MRGKKITQPSKNCLKPQVTHTRVQLVFQKSKGVSLKAPIKKEKQSGNVGDTRQRLRKMMRYFLTALAMYFQENNSSFPALDWSLPKCFAVQEA